LSLLFALILSLSGCAALHRPAPEPYLGQFVYRYATGDAYRFEVKDGDTLFWRGIAGEELGRSGEEHPERFKVADGIYFVAWIEADGATVTQVLNFNSNEVYTTVVKGDLRSLLAGTIERETPP